MAVTGLVGSYDSVNQKLVATYGGGYPFYSVGVYVSAKSVYPFVGNNGTYYYTANGDGCTIQSTDYWETSCSPPNTYPPVPDFNYRVRVNHDGTNSFAWIACSTSAPKKPSSFTVTRQTGAGFYYNKLEWTYNITGANAHTYNIYRSVNGGAYQFLSNYHATASISGSDITLTYSDGNVSGLNPVNTYDYYVCGVNQIGTGTCSDSVEGTMFFAPSGLTVTGTSATDIGISWTNNQTGFDDITIKIYSGYTWIDFATVADGTSSYVLTGLTDNTPYDIKVCSNIEVYELCSETVSTSTDIRPFSPSGLTQTDDYFNSITVGWINNSGGTFEYIEALIYTGTSWSVVEQISSGSTSYIYTGLTANSSYPLRVRSYSGGTYFHTEIITGTTRTILAPTLSGNIYSISAVLTWVNNSSSEGIKVYYKASADSTWIEWDDVASGTTNSVITSILPKTSYDFKVASYYDTIEFDSNTLTLTSGLYPFSLCLDIDTKFSTTGATCGTADGVIAVDNVDYLTFYDLMTYDLSGGSYSFVTNPAASNYGQCTGLSANYYYVTVTVKDAFRAHFGDDNCQTDYILIQNTSTSLGVTNTRVRRPECGPFDIQSGRMIWTITGSSSTYGVYVFREESLGSTYYSLTGITGTNITFSDYEDGCYFTIIESEDDGCRILLEKFCAERKNIASIAGIKRLFVSPWSSDLDWNYWQTSDEDYYFESQDTSQFFSTKIKEYLSLSGGTLTWYKIPVKGTMNLTQSLSKVRQGILLQDTLNVDVPKAIIDRFTHFSTLLPNRWVYVLEDNMGQWWTGGYQVGASIESYVQQTGLRDEENKYSFNIVAQSADKLLTNLDSTWVNNYLLFTGAKPNTPTISVGACSGGTTTITISNNGSTGTTIVYTTNGTEPTRDSTVYTAPFSTAGGVTIKAMQYIFYQPNSDVATQAVESCLFPTTGLQSYWNYDTNSGTTLYDRVGSVDGTLSGTSWVTGKNNYAILMSSGGSNSYIDFGVNYQFERTDSFSVSMWIMQTGGTTGFDILIGNLRSTPVGGWRLVISLAASLLFEMYGTGNDDFLSELYTFSANTWYHVAFSYNGSAVILYVNGVNIGSKTLAVTGSIQGGDNLFIGYLELDNTTSPYAFDETGIWNRALTEVEVGVLYNYGNGNFDY